MPVRPNFTSQCPRGSCMNCGGGRETLTPFMDLGMQPSGNHFPTLADEEAGNVATFPMVMAVCELCWQVQLMEMPSEEFLFAKHPYVSGCSQPVLSHFKEMTSDIVRKLNVPKGSLVVDIGSNDGSLLSEFRAHGMRVLGVDPCENTAPKSWGLDVPVIQRFWNERTAQVLKTELLIQPRVITATAVFYHISDIHSFVKGLLQVMDDHSVFIAQCVYMKTVLEQLQFDHFYHEHSMMHCITPLQRLFAYHGLRMIDVDFYDIHGGSFVLYVARESSSYSVSDSVQKALEAERLAGICRMETYLAFTIKVEVNRCRLVALLRTLKADGRIVYALGAPLKGSTLLNYCGITSDLVSLATEVNEFKIGKCIPGTKIPIIAESSLADYPFPDFLIVLSWNFLEFFVSKHRSYLEKGGRFICPNPRIRIVGKHGNDVTCMSPTTSYLGTPMTLTEHPPDEKAEKSRHVLIIGASGFLGAAFFRSFPTSVGTCSASQIDDRKLVSYNLATATDAEADALVQHSEADVVILVAGISAPEAEADPAYAEKAMVEGTLRLARAAVKYGAKIVYLSSDYVFGGADNGSNVKFNEDDPTCPSTVHGKIKVDVESFLLASAPSALIVRTSCVYGACQRPSSFLFSLMAAKREGITWKASTAAIQTPIFCTDLVVCIRCLIEEDACGIYHVVGDEVMSRYEFCRTLAPETVIPLEPTGFDGLVRPRFTALDNSKVKKLLGKKCLFRTVRDSLPLLNL